MSPKDVSDRVAIEKQILGCISDALRVAMLAPIDDDGSSQWLDRFNFIAHSYCRHLLRLMEIEEEGGYMDFLDDVPNPFEDDAERLLAEHQELQVQLADILEDSRQIGVRPAPDLESLRQRMNGMLHRVDLHHRKERQLCLSALLQETGGEG